MFLDPLFKLMSEKHASDMFFTVGAPIQIKINGTVQAVNAQALDGETVKKIAYEAMTPEQIKAFEETHEMNFGLTRGEIGNFRLNIFRQRNNVAIVIRYVTSEIASIEQLKLPQVLKELVMSKLGLILVVGSTGSGKSSTLAAMIDYRNGTKSGHILTLEDPIEFLYKHKKSIVNQREVGIDTNSYQAALISAMREAPDLLLIGEIRDKTTLESALLFAQTGHLCLSTLHANNSYHALNRIINFFPHDAREALLADLAISLKAVISQRLIKSKNGGRVPAVEILINTPHISELIKKGAINDIKDAMEQSLSPGSQTFEQALYQLYASEQITIENALANSDSPSNLHWLISNKGASGAPEKAFDPTATVTQTTSDFASFKFNLDENKNE